MGQIGPWQIVIILAVVVLLFGAKRLPDTARALGKSLRILKSETGAMKNDAPATPETDDQQAPPAPKTIKAAPGDVTGGRPVEEPRSSTHQG
ncbi:Sec-independent protein translocase subunit TatA [Streptomyces alkaliphilus]|uniref:Sec-independent protein translocase protein TatA n=1 Tax=Streptomyces alkaliphilus TaxID=1472722 RepID=A0A7W3Y0P9_9ACTN|nr:Sec-independent protein translocase subunit TatA [Streptomyces alkaliphilus]MBB0243688.1 twin-arginine translocase TatA/TatE family subunit [Streptomyces alkaliphilus]MQS09832.1 twin-arginine translocase TatA/TatE family subunit [Streptomyces alkaliphilus]